MKLKLKYDLAPFYSQMTFFTLEFKQISFLIYDVESSNELCNLNKIYLKYLKTNCLIFVKKRSLNPDKINM